MPFYARKIFILKKIYALKINSFYFLFIYSVESGSCSSCSVLDKPNKLLSIEKRCKINFKIYLKRT